MGIVQKVRQKVAYERESFRMGEAHAKEILDAVREAKKKAKG